MKTEKGRKSRRGKAGAFCIFLSLLLAALFVPQGIFALQDALRYREYGFGTASEQNITLLQDSYETSLYRRLERFAQEKSDGVPMYVTEQDLEPGEELEAVLKSDKGLYQNGILLWVDAEYLPADMVLGEFNGKMVTAWKQYVIYSENFAKGVNFIIWYIEMENPAGCVVKLLLDAQTGDVYGIRTDCSRQRENAGEEVPGQDVLLDMATEEEMNTFWAILCYLYGGVAGEGSTADTREKKLITSVAELSGLAGYEVADSEMYSVIISDAAAAVTEEEWGLDKVAECSASEDGTEWTGKFHYGENRLDFTVKFEGSYSKKFYEVLWDGVLGFPDIMELVPEFGEA